MAVAAALAHHSSARYQYTGLADAAELLRTLAQKLQRPANVHLSKSQRVGFQDAAPRPRMAKCGPFNRLRGHSSAIFVSRSAKLSRPHFRVSSAARDQVGF